MRNESKTVTVTSSANTTNQEDTIFTAESGHPVKVTGVTLFIEGSAGQDVSAQVFSGDRPVAPTNNALNVSGEMIDLEASKTVSPDDVLDLRHDNNDGSNHDITAIIDIERVEE